MGKFILFILFLFYNINYILNQTIGIDIGSEFFKVCIIFPGNKYRMVENLHSRIKTPNGIYMKGTDRLFENDVLDKRIKDSKSSFIFLNNYFGQKYNSSFIKNFTDFYFYNYDIEEDKERQVINFKVKYMLNHKKNETYKSIPIELIYGSIFRYIKKLSEIYYKEQTNQIKSIDYCFISIPSFFTYKQRLSLIQSVKISKLKLLGLTNENSGVAVYYYIRNYDNKNSPQYYIYYNMGSSYTQISLFEYLKEEVHLINDVYDKEFGGNTLTRNLVLLIIKKINEKNNNSLKLDIKTYNKIYPYAIKYKEMLSANKEIHFTIIIDYKKYEDFITRDEFNNINQDYFNRIPKLLDSLFSKGNITIENITQIELIGGSIRVPELQNVLKKYLGEEKEKILGTHLNGDDSIANGAAYTFKKNKILKGDGNHFNIYIEIYSLYNNSNILYKKSILFSEKTEYESSNKINLIYDNDIYINIFENDDILFSYNVTRINDTINQFKREVIKNETNVTLPKPIIRLNFKFSKIGLIYLNNPEIVFTLNYYLTLKNENLTNLTKTEKDFTYTLQYVPQLSKEEKDNITTMLNNTSLNLTKEEKNYYFIKLQIGNIYPREYPINLLYHFIDNYPKSLNTTMLKFYENELDSFDQFEKDQEVIIVMKNIIETLLYTKKSFLEGDYGKKFGKEEEINKATEILKEVNDWYEEEGNYLTNLTLLNEKIKLLNDTFLNFEKRESLYKKREIAFEKFYVQLKNLDKEYNKLKKEKPWVEYYYEDTFYDKVQKIIKYVKDKEDAQKLLKLYDDPIVNGDEIDEKREEILREYKIMENLEKPRHPERERNIKVDDLYDDSFLNWFNNFL